MKRILVLLRDLYQKFTMGGVTYARSKGMQVGKNCRILTTSLGSEPWLISVGNNVTITSGVRIVTHDGSTSLCSDNQGRRYIFRKVTIGNNVFVGFNSIVMPGVVIEDDVIVAAGSVLTKSVPKGKIVGGNPAKIIGDFYTYKENVLNTYISDSDLDKKKNYRARIEEVLDTTTKDYLKD